MKKILKDEKKVRISWFFSLKMSNFATSKQESLIINL